MPRICVIPGDGIGPQVIDAALEVLHALDFEAQYRFAQAGFECYQMHNNPLPQETLEEARLADAILFGAVTTPPHIAGYKSPIVALRQQLELFANVRPNRSWPNSTSFLGVDVTIIRENTEGLYAGEEEVFDEYAVTKRIISKKASQRIAQFGFEYARKAGKTKITVVHKANVMRATDGLFLQEVEKVSKTYPEIELELMIVDAMAMKLIQYPQAYEILLTTNMFGDILSDEACALVGGLGLASSANIGARQGLFEPVHGSAPDIASFQTANPMAAILSSALMLEYLQYKQEAQYIYQAVSTVLSEGVVLPMDLGGQAKTQEVTREIIKKLEQR